MSIRHWPSSERPREKLLQLGPQALSEAEPLAILIRTGSKGSNALEVARGLLMRFGSLRQLLTAEQQQACASPGPGRYACLQAALELVRHLSRAAVGMTP